MNSYPFYSKDSNISIMLLIVTISELLQKSSSFSQFFVLFLSDCGLLNLQSSVIAASDDITFGNSFINKLDQNSVVSNPVPVDLGLQKWQVSRLLLLFYYLLRFLIYYIILINILKHQLIKSILFSS